MKKKIIYTNGMGPIPKEILKYYCEHDYRERMIPLNGDTANEIAEILRAQGIDV